MADGRLVRTEGSRAVQGCLLGAVLLFVLLLVTMLFLAFQQFRANTRPSESGAPPPAALAPTHAPAVMGHPLELAFAIDEAVRGGDRQWAPPRQSCDPRSGQRGVDSA